MIRNLRVPTCLVVALIGLSGAVLVGCTAGSGGGTAVPTQTRTAMSSTAVSSPAVSSTAVTSEPTNPPAPSGTIPVGLPNVGTLLSDRSGHLQIRLLGPTTRNVYFDESGGENITVYTHDDVPGSKEHANTYVFSPPRTAKVEESYWQGAALQYAKVSGYTLLDQGTVRFHGRPGRTGTFTDAVNLNDQYTLLALDWSSTRMYFFFAPSGAPFNNMMASFHPIG